MSIATVTSKGQITVPADVRRELELTPGSRVDFVRRPDGAYEIVPATSTIRELKGCVPAPVTAVSLTDMDEAIADGAADGAAR